MVSPIARYSLKSEYTSHAVINTPLVTVLILVQNNTLTDIFF